MTNKYEPYLEKHTKPMLSNGEDTPFNPKSRGTNKIHIKHHLLKLQLEEAKTSIKINHYNSSGQSPTAQSEILPFSDSNR